MTSKKTASDPVAAGQPGDARLFEPGGGNPGDAEAYRTLVESSSDAIFVINPDCRVQYANAAAEALLERPLEEIVNNRLDVLFPEDLASRMSAAILSVFETGETAMNEALMRFPAGAVWQHVGLVPLKAADGTVSAVFGLARDITDLKRAEAAILASEARYRALVEAVGDIVFVVGKDDQVQYVNAGAAQWLNTTPEALIGKNRSELFPENVAWGRSQAESLHHVLRTGDSLYIENMAEFPGGTRWQGTSLAPVRDADGNVTAVLGIGRDITKRKRAEEALTSTNEELQARISEVERLSSQVSALNRTGQLLLGCRTAQEVYDVFSSFAAELFPGTSGGLAMRDTTGLMVETIAEWGEPSRLEKVFTPDDCWAIRLGRLHISQRRGLAEAHVSSPEREALCVPLVAQGQTRGVLTLVSEGANLADDILQQHAMSVAEQLALALANVRLRAELESQAVHDPLTRLYNRRFLDETLLREFHRAARKGDVVGVIIIDIDHFKLFNDEFGHSAGDEVLRALAEVAENAIRAEDTACRFGGDEVVLVLPGVSSVDALARAEAIRKQICILPLEGDVQHQLPPLTISAGVASYPRNGIEPEDVIGAADKALYRAKDAGRNRVEGAG